ncbi:LamB/YcsF family protein [Camelliibacillus cellulosilyticus]|uniref:5-oxoprolinase subunit A n=1 Tax=Camelliibacillus cellulosilyticus TaxID=2174486 RepID=A0ABV9GMM6_9BACL
MTSIDLNGDMGESFGAYRIGADEQLLNFVTSANIACGFHAGDPKTMRQTVQMALDKDIGIGAHPGYPDLNGFGRRFMDFTPVEVYDLMTYQIGALDAFVRAEGGRMQHVKAHGALYNVAARDRRLADAIAKAVYRVNPELILYGLAGSELINAGKSIGLQTASEVFADRGYQDDGTLVPRAHPDALIHDADRAGERVVRMVKEGKVQTALGSDIILDAETICLHGDGPKALEFARTIIAKLTAADIKIQKPVAKNHLEKRES